MSFDHTSFLKNFQPVIASYQDVSAIYAKLFTQGQLQKIAGLLSEIYDEEHVFTLTGNKQTQVYWFVILDRAPKVL